LLATATFANATTIAPVKIDELYRQADVVAAIEIVSGTTEHYNVSVYKAKVTRAFKRCKQGDVIYLGPFTGMKVGWQYLAFLHKTNGLTPVGAEGGLSYGIIPVFYQIMYDGYGVLKLDYACVFDAADIKDQCQDAVFFNPEQVIMPVSIELFPKRDADAVTNYKKWAVRKGVFDLLDELTKTYKATQQPSK
jgi:hypothetical protein